MDQLPRLGKRELICLLLFTCNYVVSVWRGFLFLWVLGTSYVILLWHSLSLPLMIFMILNLLNLHAHIKMPKNIHSSVLFLKHDIITLKIRFIKPLHDKTSDLDFASRVRVFTVRMKKAMNCHLLPIECTARTLIRPV